MSAQRGQYSLGDIEYKPLGADPIAAIEDEARRYGLSVSSGARSASRNRAAGGSPTSRHLVDDARDLTGDPQKMREFYRHMRSTYGPNLKELYHDPEGGFKNGQDIAPIGGHGDHVHVAIGQRGQFKLSDASAAPTGADAADGTAGLLPAASPSNSRFAVHGPDRDGQGARIQGLLTDLTSANPQGVGGTRSASQLIRRGENGQPLTHDGYPAIKNPDGSLTTERSITVTSPKLNNGMPTNIPSVWGGKQLSNEAAIERARSSGVRYPSFPSISEAVKAARARSVAKGRELDRPALATPRIPARPPAPVAQSPTELSKSALGIETAFNESRAAGDKAGMERYGRMLQKEGWEAGPGEDGWWYVKPPTGQQRPASQGAEKFVADVTASRQNQPRTHKPVYIPGVGTIPAPMAEGAVDLAAGVTAPLVRAAQGIARLPGAVADIARKIPMGTDPTRMPEQSTAPEIRSSYESNPAEHWLGTASMSIEEFAQANGLEPGLAKELVTAAGGLAPLLLLKRPLAIGGLTAAESYGRGEPLGQALKAGAEQAAVIGTMGVGARGLDEAITGTGVPRAAARLTGRTAVNVAAPNIIRAATGQEQHPITPGEAVMGAGFALAHGAGEKPASEASRRAAAGAAETRGVADVSTGQAPSELVPEPPEAITAQLEALRAGRGNRRAVLVPTEDQMPISKGELTAQGLTTTKIPNVGVFIHVSDPRSPLRLSHGEVRDAARDGTYYGLLGIVQPKSADTTEAVTARNRACVSGDTRIWNPITGTHRTIKELAEEQRLHAVLSLTPRGLRVSWANAPFKKGVAELFEIRLFEGQVVRVTRDHRMLTPDGWQSIATGVSVRGLVAIVRGGERAHVPCYLGITQDSPDRYFACSDPDGEPLPGDQESDLSSLPSPAGVLTRILDGWRVDDRDAAVLHNPASDVFRPSSAHSQDRAAHGVLTYKRSADQIDAFSSSVYVLKHPAAPPPWQVDSSLPAGSLPYPDQSGFACCQKAASRTLQDAVGSIHATDSSQIADPVQPLFSRSDTTKQPPSLAGSFYSHGDFSTWEEVVSIRSVGIAEYFDMEVPGPANYFGEGVLHHNSGGELQAAMTSPENIPAQAAELKAQHPEAKIAVEPAENVIADRVASVPFMITRARQQLSDLGYSRVQIDRMNPDAVRAILESGRRSDAAPKPVATIPQQSQGRYRLEDAEPAKPAESATSNIIAKPAKPVAEAGPDVKLVGQGVGKTLAVLGIEKKGQYRRLADIEINQDGKPTLIIKGSFTNAERVTEISSTEAQQISQGAFDAYNEFARTNNQAPLAELPVIQERPSLKIAKPTEAPKAEPAPEPDLHHSAYQPRDEGKFAGEPEYPTEDARSKSQPENSKKAPWQMSREEYFRYSHKESGSPLAFPEREVAALMAHPERLPDTMLGHIETMRRAEVARAIRESKPVPAAVLADYPDLALPRSSSKSEDAKATAILEGKERALPKTLDAAQLEGGENRTYQPTSILGGSDAGRELVKEKGVDGAIEHVLHGDAGIEWASTGYAAMEQLRADEAKARVNDPAAADEIQARRLRFVGDFAAEATKRGQAIAGIRAIEEFAPDRAVYIANKLSQGKRRRGLSPDEEARIAKTGEDLQAARDRIKSLEAQLEAQAATKKRSAKETKKANYQTKLEEQGATAKQMLAGRLANLDFGNLGRPGERGAVKIGEPPLPGDAELLAQYAASRLAKLNTAADLNAEITKEFGAAVEPHLPAIRRRALSIREEARLAEIKDSEPERRRTILQEIQQEVTDLNQRRRATEAQAAKDAAAQRTQAKRETSAQAREVAKAQRAQEAVARDAEKEFQRERLAQARKESVAASKAAKTAYRTDIRTQREAARKAELWDTPLREDADDARMRLASADPKAPETLDDLVSVATEMLLPAKAGGAPRGRAVIPGKFYVDLKSQFPDLVTRKNQGQIYKRALQRVQDMTKAAREASRLASASKEERRLWNEAGIDTDAQALLIQRAEAQRQQLEARSQMTREFNRVSRSRLARVGFEIQALPRALQSSIDAPIGRQGLFYLVTHPIETARFTIPATAKGYAASREGYHQLVADMQKHPDYRLAEKAGVDLPGIASEVDARVAAEEPFQSTAAERLFWVRLSEQGFTHGMNAQRLAAFSRYADLGRASGYTWESNPEFFQQAAQYVNAATGRGNMPETLKRATALTNALFYSTRLQVSRVQLLNNLLNPVKYVKYDPAMRKIAAGEAIRLAVGMALILGTAKAAGLKVTTNPDDPDFGKVVWGKIHYDLTAGEGALIRAVYRLVKATTLKINGDQPGYKQDTLDILWDLTRKKLAPWPGAAVNLLAGKDVVGHPANLSFKNPEHKPAGRYIQDLQDQNQIVRIVAPMVAGDFIDAANEEGWVGVAKTMPGLGGVGIQAYDPDNPRTGPRTTRVATNPYLDAIEKYTRSLKHLGHPGTPR